MTTTQNETTATIKTLKEDLKYGKSRVEQLEKQLEDANAAHRELADELKRVPDAIMGELNKKDVIAKQMDDSANKKHSM